MRANRTRPGVAPQLEPLEPRLAPAASLTPLPGDPARFTLRIDLTQHPRGQDGRPDALFVSRADGAVSVVLVGRQPEALYRGDAAAIDRIELVGSADVDYVLVGDRLAPPLSFAAGAGDVLVQLGEPIPVPPPVEEPEFAGPLPDHDPAGGPGRTPAPPPEGQTAPPVIAPNSDVVFAGGLFLGAATVSPPPVDPARTTEEEERPSVPPELLGGGLTEEPLDVRRLTGGSHDDRRAGAWDEASAEQEPAGDEEPPEDPEPVSPPAEPT